MSTVISNSLLSSTLRYAAAASPVEQTASLSFARTVSTRTDAVAKLKNTNVGSRTTALTINLSLQKGQQYNFARTLPGNASGLKATLIDASGSQTALDLASAFSVASSGQYKLRLDGTGSIKKEVDATTIEARYLEQTACLAFAQRCLVSKFE